MVYRFVCVVFIYLVDGVKLLQRRFTAEAQRRREIPIVCRSDFSRELLKFATKVAPTNTCNNLRALNASAVNNKRLDLTTPCFQLAVRVHLMVFLSTNRTSRAG